MTRLCSTFVGAALVSLSLCAGCGTQRAAVVFRGGGAPGAPGMHRYEYVFPDREMDVFDAQPPFRLVERVRIPAFHSLRGVAVDPASGTVYASVGGNGGSSGDGALVAFDLFTNRVLWRRAFPTGTDSLAITPDGRTLYVPEGERTMGDVWHVVAARTGRVTGEIHAAPGPHNTIVSPDGTKVYLGPATRASSSSRRRGRTGSSSVSGRSSRVYGRSRSTSSAGSRTRPRPASSASRSRACTPDVCSPRSQSTSRRGARSARRVTGSPSHPTAARLP